jgi:hypothetical protein
VLVLRPAAFAFADLAPYFHDADGLASWLTTAGRIGAAGDRCALELRDGGRLTGEVLASTALPEVTVSWDELDAVLELKAISAGPGRPPLLGVRVTGWRWSPDRAADVERCVTAAVERLAARFAPAARS